MSRTIDSLLHSKSFPLAPSPGIYQGRMSLQAHQEGSAAEDVFSCKTELLFCFGSFDFNFCLC